MNDDHPIERLETRGTRRGASAIADDVATSLVMRRNRRVGATLAVALIAVVWAGVAVTQDNEPTIMVVNDSEETSTTLAPTTTSQQLDFEGEGSAGDAIKEAEEAWASASVSDYFLRVTPLCAWCGERAYLSKVVDGRAVATVGEDTQVLHGALSDGSKWTPTTVDELFALLGTYNLASTGFAGGSTYRFTLDESGQWPTNISLDPITNAIDDEQGFEVSLFLEEPAIFAGEIVEVVVATGHTFRTAPVSLVVESATTTGVPESLLPANAITMAELENLDGFVLREAVTPAQILVADLFVDRWLTPMFPDLPEGQVALSFRHSADADLVVGDAVIASAAGAEIAGTVLWVHREGNSVTLQVLETEAHALIGTLGDITLLPAS